MTISCDFDLRCITINVKEIIKIFSKRKELNNPVDWYPWGKEAFQKAKALVWNKEVWQQSTVLSILKNEKYKGRKEIGIPANWIEVYNKYKTRELTGKIAKLLYN